MNPDGTAQMAFFGNMRPGDVYLDAKPVPGGREVIMVNSPKHGRREHEGRIALVRREQGADDPEAQRILNPGLNFRDPYPLSENEFLVAQEHRLLVMDREGATRELFRLEGALAEGGATGCTNRGCSRPGRANR